MRKLVLLNCNAYKKRQKSENAKELSRRSATGWRPSVSVLKKKSAKDKKNSEGRRKRKSELDKKKNRGDFTKNTWPSRSKSDLSKSARLVRRRKNV